MPTPRNDTYLRILALLRENGLMSAPAIAALIGKPEYSVRATLRGMINRREVRVTRPSRRGKSHIYEAIA